MFECIDLLRQIGNPAYGGGGVKKSNISDKIRVILKVNIIIASSLSSQGEG
jgi:hypothetical protein